MTNVAHDSAIEPVTRDTTPVPIDDGPDPAGPIANAAASLVAVGIGVIGIVLSLGLQLGEPARPGPGLWPLTVSITIVVLSLIQLVVGRRGGDGERFSRASSMAALGLVSLIVFVALMPLIGFEIPGFLLCVTWMRVLGAESWLISVLGAALIVALFYAVFVLALGTAIPHLFGF